MVLWIVAVENNTSVSWNSFLLHLPRIQHLNKFIKNNVKPRRNLTDILTDGKDNLWSSWEFRFIT